MNTSVHFPTRKILSIIILIGFLVVSCFRPGSSPVVHAEQAGPPAEPLAAGSSRVDPPAGSKSGWFSIIWGDGLEGATQMLYSLTDDNGRTTLLSLDERLAQSIGGVLALNHKYLSVQGISAPSPSDQSAPAVMDVTFMGLAASPGTEIQETVISAAVSGPKPWISIMCKFNNYSVEPKNQAFFQGMYASSKPGLDHYWRELSYDTANVTGSNAAGWFVLPHPESYYNPSDTTGGTNLSLLATDCIAVADASVNYSLYAGINMMFNTDFDNGYAWGGSRYMTLDGVTKSWSTTWEPPWGYASISVIAHEMGHGFGLPHSSGNYGATYDNAWDVMSQDRYNCSAATDPTYGCLGQHTISYHMDILGWIPAGQKFSAGLNTNTTITLEQLALPQTGNYKMAQIPINGSSSHFYTVEARRLTGYDAKLPGNAVVIHEVDTTRSKPAYVIDVDNNGLTSDAGAMWLEGETFSDAANGISVTVISATATGFVVSINNTASSYTLSVSKNGTGGGTVTSSPAGIACGSSCSAAFDPDTKVMLTAAASSGSSFTGWGSACSGTGTCEVTMNAAKSVTATFTLITYNLSVSKDGTGSGTVTSSPAGINCGSTCSAAFVPPTSVTLTAAAASGSTFAGWGGACSGTGTCEVTMDAAKSVTATFTMPTYTLTVNKGGAGSGSVTSKPLGINCGSVCSYTFPFNTRVTLTAVASSGSTFTGWSGGGCSGTRSCTITLQASTSVTANFALAPCYHLTTNVSPAGSGTIIIETPTNCTGGFTSGTVVKLTATANSGFSFVNWSGGASGRKNTVSVTMKADTTVMANFK